MSYSLDYSKKARKQLGKLEPKQREAIVKWMDKNIDGCENPRLLGTALVNDPSRRWRYRIGEYRVLARIEDDELVVLAVGVAHRRKVYAHL